MERKPFQNSPWKHIKKFMTQLCLADRFLLGFMAIVMLYLTISLFFNLWDKAGSSNIDAIVRTTGASIFGYFIGGSFLHQTPAQSGVPKKPTVSASSVDMPDAKDARPQENRQKKEKISYVRQQVFIIGCIGLIALLLLVVLPGEKVKSPSSIAAVSQLRDFVSGSVGLLIGHSSRGKG